MKIRSIVSALLLVALVLSSCTQQNTEVKVGTPSTSADTDVKTNNWPSTLLPSKLFLFTRNGKYGYIDRTGKIVIPAKLDTPYENSNSVTPVGVGDSLPLGTASQNENRDELIIFAEDDISANMTREFAYRLGIPGVHPDKSGSFNKHSYGYKNRRTGKVIIRPQFNRAADQFSEGLAWVMDERDGLGYIDKQGKMVIPPQYNYSRSEAIGGGNFTNLGSDFNDGLAKVCSAGQSEKCGYIDHTGKVVIPLKFDDAAEKFSNGLAWVRIERRFGYIDKTGKINTPLQSYSSADDFDGGLARVCADDEGGLMKCGYIDRTGKVVIALKFDRVARKFSNGLAWVVINKRFGYIDKTGKVKIPAKFTDPSINTGNPYAKEGAISMSNGNGWFIANIDFDRGLALVRIPKTCGFSVGEATPTSDENDCDGYGYIDTTGKLVFEF
jgi:WG containing repeat